MDGEPASSWPEYFLIVPIAEDAIATVAVLGGEGAEPAYLPSLYDKVVARACAGLEGTCLPGAATE